MDVLTDLLQRSRARGAAFSRTHAYGTWGLSFPVTGALAVHAIVDGEIFAWTHDPAEALRVTGGDVLLLRGNPHHLASRPGAPTVPFLDLLGGPDVARQAALGRPGDGAVADFCCGAYLFEGDLSRPLLDALPELARLRPEPGSALRATVDLLVREMASDGPGQQALLDRLLDVALVQALREWFGHAEQVPGWFRAMDDPALAAALRGVHADPARAWTVAELARAAAMSRSAFARRFTDVVGRPPLQYLTDWRLALARERLRDTRDSIAGIAADVGYASEFSFAAAFKRHVGAPPGRWRAERAGAAAPADAARRARTP